MKTLVKHNFLQNLILIENNLAERACFMIVNCILGFVMNDSTIYQTVPRKMFYKIIKRDILIPLYLFLRLNLMNFQNSDLAQYKADIFFNAMFKTILGKIR